MGTRIVPVPQLGVTAEEVTIVEWRVSVGATVLVGDNLLVVETEKSEIDVESPVSGWLRATAAVGAVLRIGAAMAIVTDTMDEPVNASLEVSPSDAESGRSTAARGPALSAQPAGRVAASPAARRRATELGVDLATIAGTGPEGRVVEADVEVAVARSKTALPPGRRAVARAVSASAAIPQVSVGGRAKMAGALGVVTEWRAAGEAVSITDVLVAALARAIARHRRFAVRANGIDDIADVASIDIALAIVVDDHLQAPALRAADRADLGALSRDRRRLVGAVKSSLLSARDIGEPCATVSNLGPLGAEQFQALVTPPQSCVLAVGAVRDEVVIEDGTITIAPCAQLWLTADHRLADGAHVAQLLSTCISILEGSPAALGISMTVSGVGI